MNFILFPMYGVQYHYAAAGSIEIMDAAGGTSTNTFTLDRPLAFAHAAAQEVKEATCSVNKARRMLGYKTKTTLKQSIKLTTEFIKKKGPKPFIYNIPVEIVSDITPETWIKKTI